MNQSTDIKELATALSKAQGALTGAKKDSANPFFKSRYADLESVWDACREVLAKNGLSVMQTLSSDGDRVVVTTTLAHSSGQWISDGMALTPKDSGPQAMGSCITYGRRYGLAAIVGVYQTDDDGEAAQGRVKQSDSKGDLGKGADPALVERGKLDFLTAFALDAEESEIADAVWKVHERVSTDSDLYVAIADGLTPKERRAIKDYVHIAKSKNQPSANGRRM